MISYRTKKGTKVYLAFVPDVEPNKGGFYVEVYSENDKYLDNFVIHSGSDGDLCDCDCTNEDEVENFAKNYISNVEDY